MPYRCLQSLNYTVELTIYHSQVPISHSFGLTLVEAQFAYKPGRLYPPCFVLALELYPHISILWNYVIVGNMAFLIILWIFFYPEGLKLFRVSTCKAHSRIIALMISSTACIVWADFLAHAWAQMAGEVVGGGEESVLALTIIDMWLSPLHHIQE